MCPNKDQVERGNPFPQFSYLLLLRAARGLMALFVTMDLLTHAQFDVSEASVAFSTEKVYHCKASSFPRAKLCIMPC